jgi:hypothetical protein
MPCINLYANAAGTNDAPIVIQNCTIRQAINAVLFEGRYRSNRDRPMPCGHMVFRNNTLFRCIDAAVLLGAVHHVLIAGNRILDSRIGDIALDDFMPGATDVLVVNNTLFRSGQIGMTIWDEHGKGKDFLKCKNVRCRNNLVLEHGRASDLVVLDHQRGNYNEPKPGDAKSLLQSPEWHFSHNWREQPPPKPGDPFRAGWIPPGPEDHLQDPIQVLSRTPRDPNYLRPARDSPLAWSGAGGHAVPSARIASAVGQAAGPANPWMAGWAVAQPMSQPDPSLPAYVGAVPPEGVEPWDWQKTWNALTR